MDHMDFLRTHDHEKVVRAGIPRDQHGRSPLLEIQLWIIMMIYLTCCIITV